MMTLLLQVFLLLLATTTEAINSFGGGSERNSLSAAAAASSRKFGITSTTTTTTTSDDVATNNLPRRIVNLPRGGGWFGGGNGNNNNNNGNKNKKKQTKKKYPALSQLEIEEKLNVPVFGICSSNGQGIAIGKFNNDVVAQPPGGPTASPGQDMAYFFFDKQMAQQALQNMQSANPHIKLQLATLSLGKIWFRLLENQDEQLLDCSPLINNDSDYGEDNKTHKKNKKINKKKVSFRLVAGAKEFFLAKLLTSLTPMEAQELKMAVQENSKDKARDIVMKATQQQQQQQSKHPGSTTFVSPYNQVPLFMMPQLRVKLKDGEEQQEGIDVVGDNGSSSRNSGTTPKLPVFFSSKDMVKAYLGTQNANIDLDNLDNGMSITEFAAAQQNQHGQQPIIQLIELHELVKLMQEESDFDFRSMILFTSSDDAGDQDDDDDYDDDDNDGGGGGDFPISASNDGGDDEVQIEMNIMMDDNYNDYLGGYSTNPLPM